MGSSSVSQSNEDLKKQI